jgi:hypothetical protein
MRLSHRRWHLLLLLLIITGISLLRWHLRHIPLERDEGEYALGGQLLLHGIPPYTLAYSMKLPGVLFAYAAIMLAFGESIAGIHFGLLLVNAATMVFVFLLGRRLIGPIAGLVASASYGLLATSASVLGLAAHATHFVVLPVVAASLTLLIATDETRPWPSFFAGLLVGIAFLMKQPALVFAIFGYGWLLWQSRQHTEVRRALPRFLGLYTAALLLPFALTCGTMALMGVFHRFWFWTFLYAAQYGTTLSLSEGLKNVRSMVPAVVLPNVGIWLLGIFGIVRLYRDEALAQRRFFLLSFLVCSAVAVCPGMYFRRHYFILLLPAISLLAGLGVASAVDYLQKTSKADIRQWTPVFFFLAICAFGLYYQRDYLFISDPRAAARMTYGTNPFPEALDIANYISSHSNPEDRIAILGSEPEINFYAHRLPGTGYIYTYSLMEPQPYAAEMQSDMIREIESSRPQYVVLVSIPTSFGRLRDSDSTIFSWMGAYLPAHYQLVAIQNVREPLRSVEKSPPVDYRARPNEFVKIYRRTR